MRFYLTALDRQVHEGGETPSTGSTLCKEDDCISVKYALHDVEKPIGVSTYRRVKRLPEEPKRQLPSPTEIAKLRAVSQSTIVITACGMMGN